MFAENFDMNSSDEITLKGFYSLHTLTAAESEGGVEELRAILAAMGYDRKLRLRHVSVESSVVCVWSISFVVMISIHLPPHTSLPTPPSPHLHPHLPTTGLSVLHGHSLGDV